ncbi:MAG: winged helix-turn-helix transcriptional regulator [Gemmatimonadetes bacterium]|nr:winged helix-turn-helix transcriptional regulator [Gemmatimonadota bacterium]
MSPRLRTATAPPSAHSRFDACQVDVVHLDAVRSARAALPTTDDLERVAGVIALLSNPTRLRMLFALQSARASPHTELCVCDLAVVAGATKSLTSHQLRLLRAAGLVRPRRSGRLIYYRLADGELLPLLRILASLAKPQPAATPARRHSSA